MVVFACQMFYCCFINHISWSQQPEYQKLNKQKKAEEIKLRNAWNKQSSLGCLVWSNGTILSHMLVEKKHDSLGYVCACRHVITKKYFDSADKDQCCCWGGGARSDVCMCACVWLSRCVRMCFCIYICTQLTYVPLFTRAQCVLYILRPCVFSHGGCWLLHCNWGCFEVVSQRMCACILNTAVFIVEEKSSHRSSCQFFLSCSQSNFCSVPN